LVILKISTKGRDLYIWVSWVVNNKDTIIFTQRPCWTPQYVYENMTPTVKHVFAVKEWLQTYSVKVYSLSKSWRLQFFKYFLDNCKFHCILEISSIQILNFTTLNLQYNSSLNLKSSYKKSVISNFLLKMVSNFTMYSFGSRSNLFCQAQNERQNVLYRKWSHQYVRIEFLIDKNNLKKSYVCMIFNMYC
jgi:hypothetical protein